MLTPIQTFRIIVKDQEVAEQFIIIILPSRVSIYDVHIHT